ARANGLRYAPPRPHRDRPSLPTRRSSDLAPPELAGQAINVEYISTLAHAQRSVHMEGIERIFGFTAQLSGVEPALQRKLDPFERSEEHTSELQSRENLVCRLLLGKKKEQP